MRVDRRHALGLGASLAAATAVGAAPASYGAFGSPRDVTLRGYAGDAMEPFLSRDGRWLFFNNRNDPGVDTNLYCAERLDDLAFAVRGPIVGANSPALDAVASMDRDGWFYFVSTRSYADTFSTLYRARFADGALGAPELIGGVSRRRPGWVNFDAEITADGARLYLVDSWFGPLGKPQRADIVVAERTGGGFAIGPRGLAVTARVNAAGINYAPCTSADELELFFTRAPAPLGSAAPRIWRAARTSSQVQFGEPQAVAAIAGFAEGATISPDGRSLYYHARAGERFVIRRVTR